MKKIKYPATRTWKVLAQRPSVNTAELTSTVQKIFDDILENGDAAVAKYTQRFDKISIPQTRVSAAEIKAAAGKLSKDLKEAMLRAAQNIRKFHSTQIEKPKVIRTMKGV